MLENFNFNASCVKISITKPLQASSISMSISLPKNARLTFIWHEYEKIVNLYPLYIIFLYVNTIIYESAGCSIDYHVHSLYRYYITLLYNIYYVNTIIYDSAGCSIDYHFQSLYRYYITLLHNNCMLTL